MGVIDMLGFRKGMVDAIIEKAAELSSQDMRKLVFADTEDHIIQACSVIQKRRVARPILLGNSGVLMEKFSRLGIKNLDDDNIIDYLLPDNKDQLEAFAKEFLEMRKKDGKIMTLGQAREKMKEPAYYGAMLVNKDLAQGMIAGATSKTKPYYPVFEVIKMAEGVQKISGVFLMVGRSGKDAYFFADCVMNIAPAADILAEIAEQTAKTAKSMGLSPRVAMLSFSTRDSAKHESVERVKLATQMVKRRQPDFLIDGEIQVDAALVPGVFRRKCFDSVLKGEANVLIFPDLNSANIAYKLVERLGGFKAIGPLLQGVKKPVNDLSRGCGADDVVAVAAVTVLQSGGSNFIDENKQPKADKEAKKESENEGEKEEETDLAEKPDAAMKQERKGIGKFLPFMRKRQEDDEEPVQQEEAETEERAEEKKEESAGIDSQEGEEENNPTIDADAGESTEIPAEEQEHEAEEMPAEKQGRFSQKTLTSEEKERAYNNLPSNIRKVIEAEKAKSQRPAVKIQEFEESEDLSESEEQENPEEPVNREVSEADDEPEEEAPRKEGDFSGFVNEWKEREKKRRLEKEEKGF